MPSVLLWNALVRYKASERDASQRNDFWEDPLHLVSYVVDRDEGHNLVDSSANQKRPLGSVKFEYPVGGFRPAR